MARRHWKISLDGNNHTTNISMPPQTKNICSGPLSAIQVLTNQVSPYNRKFLKVTAIMNISFEKSRYASKAYWETDINPITTPDTRIPLKIADTSGDMN